MARLAVTPAVAAALLFAVGCGGDKDSEAPAKKVKDDSTAARIKATTPSPEPAKPEPPPPPPSDDPVTHELDKLGYSIQTPPTWKKRDLNPKVVSFKIPGGVQQAGALITSRVDIQQVDKGPRSLAAAAKKCPADVTDKNTEDSGRFYYVCKQTAMRRTVLSFQYVIPGKGKKKPGLICSGSGADVEPLLEACKTLAKL